MPQFLGIDTSNYTTSAALIDTDTKAVVNSRKLLPVREGQKGLRQSDAVFLHTKALPEILEKALLNSEMISAVGVSVSPRDIEGSYMPCFLSGLSVASGISYSQKIPLHKFSHQRGHIAAALYSANKLELVNTPFIAFHISGGTTDAVIVTPDKDLVIKCNTARETLDLNAGQVIDRVGVMLGLKFPAGAELEKLAIQGVSPKKIKSVLKNGCPCLSGVENQCANMLRNGEKKENIARYAIDFIAQTIKLMAKDLIDEYGNLPMVFAGGVMSDKIIKNELQNDFQCVFASAEYSCDNAVGIAVLTAIKEGYLI